MRNDASPTAFDTLVHQRFCVMAVRITLQSMEMHQHRRVELHRLRFRPIQHDEVSVGHIHNFSSILHVGTREKTGGNDGLKMRSGQPAGSIVVGLKQRHRANKRKKNGLNNATGEIGFRRQSHRGENLTRADTKDESSMLNFRFDSEKKWDNLSKTPDLIGVFAFALRHKIE